MVQEEKKIPPASVFGTSEHYQAARVRSPRAAGPGHRSRPTQPGNLDRRGQLPLDETYRCLSLPSYLWVIYPGHASCADPRSA
jgi:hypothetical protein